MMNIRIFGLVAALLLLPSAAVAQAPQERIDAAMAQAQEVGIPTALLESKMAEGRAKGVPMDRIAMAVENRLQGLTRALEVMSRGTDELDAAQLSVGADALASGVEPETLVELVQSAPRERLLVAVAALGHLVERGLPVDQAVEAVNQALARGPRGFAGIPGFAGPPADLPAGPVGPRGKGPGGDGPQVGPPGSVPPPGQIPDIPRPPRTGPPGGGF